MVDELNRAFGDSICITREPGGSPFGEAIREVALKHPLAKDAPPETMLLLMFASRFDHVIRKVMPMLNSGKSVVSDRFDESSYAYNVWAQTADAPVQGDLEPLFWQIRARLPVLPDLYVFLDVDPKIGLARLHNQAGADINHFDEKNIKFHEDVRDAFKRFLPKVPHVVIDANAPLEDVKREFLAQIKKHLP